MPITVRCANPACGVAFQVPDAYAGKRGRCASCQQKFVMNPVSADETAAPAAQATADSVQPPPAPRPAPSHQTPQRIARFVVRARLGAGAFGTVYRAWDPQLEREVALKVPQAAVLDSPKRIERFLREAKAAAGLRHPSIVPVYDAGEDGEVRYIASAFIEGKPLSGAVEEKGMDCRRAAVIVRQLGDALGYAHGLGVVHRDVKPANVMLDAEDKPHLMDFGLASRQDSIEKLTHEGAVMGTPAYMSPEQAKGQQGEAKPESDQYALGVVLYELLTGRTPFEGPPQIVLFNVLQTEPPAPRTLRKDVPLDLETICLKAMAKRPDDRYSDCQAFAEDLGRWLEGEPIRARRLGLGERFVRWCKREPKLALASGLMAASLLALVGAAGLMGVQHFWSQVVKERTAHARTEEQKKDAEEALGKATADLDEEKERGRRDNNLNIMAQAQARLDADDRAGAYLALGRIPDDQRGWVWRHLRLRAEGSGVGVRVLTWPGNERFVGGAIAGIAFSADSQKLAALDRNGAMHAWHVGSGLGLKKWTLARHEDKGGGWPQLTTLSADGRIAATAYSSPEPPPPEVHQLTAAGVVGLAGSSPSGPLLAASRVTGARGVPFWVPGLRQPRQPRTLVISDAATGEKLRVITGPAGEQIQRQLSADGKTLAFAAGGWGEPMEFRVYDTSTGKENKSLRQRLTGLRHVALSADGKTVATTSGDESKPPVLALRDSESGKESLKLEGDIEGVEQVAFSPDGKFVLGSGGGMRAEVVTETVPVTVEYTVDVEKVIERPVEVEKEVDGKKVKEKVLVKEKVRVPEKRQKTEFKSVMKKRMGGGDSKMLVWSAAGKLLHTLPDCAGGLVAAVSPDGTMLARVCHGPCMPVPHLSIFDLGTGLLLLKTPVPEGLHISQLVFSPDGLHLAGVQQYGSRVVLWSATGGRLLYQYDAHDGPVTALAFSPDGRLISSFSACNGAARVWAAKTGKTVLATRSGGGMHGGYGHSYGAHGGGGGMSAPCCTPDGERLIGTSSDGKLSIWDRKTGKPIDLPKDVGMILAVSPDASLIVTAPEPKPFVPDKENPGGVVRPVQVSRRTPTAHDLLAAMTLLQAPKGEEKEKEAPAEVKVRDARTGKEVCALKGLPAFGVRFEFSPDSKRLVSVAFLGWGPGGSQNELKVWDPRAGTAILTHAGAGGAFALSEDGKRLASIQPPPPLPPQPPQMKDKDKKMDKKAEAQPPMKSAELVSFQDEKKPAPKEKDSEPPTDRRTRVKVFDLDSGKEVRTITVKQGVEQIHRLEFGPDGRFLAAAGGQHFPPRQVFAWDTSTGKEILARDDFAGELAFSRDGDRLALAVGGRQDGGGMGMPMPVRYEEDGPAPAVPQPETPVEVKVYDLATGKASLSLAINKERVAGLAFSPDGSRLVTTGGVWMHDKAGTGPSDVRVWDARAGKVLFAFTGHTGVVSAFAFSPDGTLLATGGYDGSVKVWLMSLTITVEGATWEVGKSNAVRAASGEAKLRHWDHVDAVAFSPDGTLVASAGNDAVVRLHDVATGTEKMVLSGHQGGVRGLAFRPDGKVLASVAWHNDIRLWDVATGKQVRVIRHDYRWGGPPPGSVHCVAFSPDGKTLATGHEADQNCLVQLWDAESGKRLRYIPAHKRAVVAVCFRPGGKELASASHDGEAKLWNVSDGKEVRAFKGKVEIRSMQFLPDGKELITVAHDSILRFWEVDTGKEKRTVNTGGPIFSVAVSGDGTTLATAHHLTVRVWNRTDDKPKSTLGGHRANVHAVALDRTGKRLVSGGYDRAVRLWDVEQGKELFPHAGHIGQVQGVAYSPDGKLLASAGWDGTVRLWDVASRREKSVLKGHSGHVWAVLFIDGKELASAGEDGRVRIWDVEAGKEARQLLHKGSGQARSLALSPNGKSLAVGYHHSHAVRVWDLDSGKVTHTFTGHKGDVWALLFLPDGKKLVTGSHDWSVKLWDVKEGKEEVKSQEAKTLAEGDPGAVWSLALRDGKTLIVGHEHGRLRYWDLAKGKLLREERGHESPVYAVALADGGKLLASADNRARIKLWEPGSGIEWETVLLGPWQGRVAGLAFCPKTGELATANGDGTVSVLRLPR